MMSHMFKVLLNEERRVKGGGWQGVRERRRKRMRPAMERAAALLPSDMCGGPKGGETSEPGRRSEG